MQRKVYILENLDCANCAAKIERKLSKLPELNDVSVTFATKQLRVSANNQAELLPKMQAVVDSIEDGVTIVPRQRKRPTGISNTKIYILEGLDCANCAAKIEAKLRTLNGVDDLTITYATKQMKLSAKNPDQMIPLIKETIDSIYFSEIPCLSAISISVIYSPLSCSAKSIITLNAYLPFVDIFI